MKAMKTHSIKITLTTLGVSLLLVITTLLGFIGSVVADAPPAPGKPLGPESADIGERVTFSVAPITGTGSDIYYNFNWSDGLTTGWLGPYPSDWDEPIEATHAWDSDGVYQVRVQAKNASSGEISGWSPPHSITIGIVIEPGPPFDIVGITGGFGVAVSIQNKLNASKYVTYIIDIAGGRLSGLHTHKFVNGTSFIHSNETVIIVVPAFFGIGRVIVSVTAKCAGQPVVHKRYQTRVLLFYVTNIQELEN